LKGILKYQIPPLVWVIVIYLLSAIPNIGLTIKTPPGIDKLTHAILYFVLCWLVWRAFHYQHTLPIVRTNAFLGAFIFCVAYGFLDEYHQAFTPGRDSDFYDVIADTGGALLFVAIASLRGPHRREDDADPGS
jgi:VanZ family protein